ncbi:hypothetical protein ACKKBF_B15500 [Auxenochlorella protothecoides x Auxenochlorella symbiontica]
MLIHGPHEDAPGSDLIQEGSLVVVYERFDSMKAVKVTPKGQYSNRWGNFAMKEWIGVPYGSRVHARAPDSGWAYLLAPTPELWTAVLRHRTQILYVADISMVVAMLELRPGCTVLESGTGSGSLTTSLARAVAPTGHVYTFEFHEQRAQLAREDFAANGLSDVITVQHRNIEESGFPSDLHGKADGLFLDLPGPWKAVKSAAACLRPDGVFCSFSPCIEQVQRTCGALARSGFHCLRTMEVLLRSYEVTSSGLKAVEESVLGDDLPSGEPADVGGDPDSKRAKREDGAAPEEAHTAASAAPTLPSQAQVLARPVASGRGHTGYLTFARLAVTVPGPQPQAVLVVPAPAEGGAEQDTA